MTISLTRANGANTDGGSTSATVTLPSVDGGSLLVAVVGWVDAAGTTNCNSVADTAGSTWHSLTKRRNATQGYSLQIWYAYNATARGTTDTFTATFSASSTFKRMDVGEFQSTNGSWSTDPFDSESSGSGNGTALTCSSFTPGVDNCVVIGGGGSAAGNISNGSGMTMMAPTAGTASVGTAYAVQTTKAATTAPLTASSSGQWIHAAGAFQDVPAAATYQAPQIIVPTAAVRRASRG